MSEKDSYCESLSKAVKITLLLLLAGLLIDKSEAGSPVTAKQSPHILVLDDCDSDFKTPPFNDSIFFLNSDGKVINEIGGLNIALSKGGNRAITVSLDGKFFVVCENVADKISAYSIPTGNLLWSIQGKYTSAIIAQDIVYSICENATTQVKKVHAIDLKGNFIKQSGGIEGIDIAIDPESTCFWVVGENVTKYNMNLQALQMIFPITWTAVSVDVCSDGSIWVAERAHPDDAGSQNRLIKINQQVRIVRKIPMKNMAPLCVRVDRSNDNFWVTGIRYKVHRKLSFRRWPPEWKITWKYLDSRTRKYSPEGKLLLELKYGGISIDIDETDGSVWITDHDTSNLYHYSSEGKKLNTSENLSRDHKWIAIVTKKKEGN